MITDTVYSTLNADSGVRAFVGESTSPQSSRVYLKRAAESAVKPYIVFQTISRTNLDTLSGVGDMSKTRIQINCVTDADASTAESSEAFADAVESALEGNGYLSHRHDQYDTETHSHVTIIDWSFLS